MMDVPTHSNWILLEKFCAKLCLTALEVDNEWTLYVLIEARRNEAGESLEVDLTFFFLEYDIVERQIPRKPDFF